MGWVDESAKLGGWVGGWGACSFCCDRWQRSLVWPRVGRRSALALHAERPSCSSLTAYKYNASASQLSPHHTHTRVAALSLHTKHPGRSWHCMRSQSGRSSHRTRSMPVAARALHKKHPRRSSLTAYETFRLQAEDDSWSGQLDTVTGVQQCPVCHQRSNRVSAAAPESPAAVGVIPAASDNRGRHTHPVPHSRLRHKTLSNQPPLPQPVPPFQSSFSQACPRHPPSKV